MIMNNLYRRKKNQWFYDRWILFSTGFLLAFGLLMVASTSMVISDRQFGYSLHYFIRQLIYLLMGLVLAWGATRIPMQFWKKISSILVIISLFFLIIVLVPGIGKVVNGSRRWISLGFISLQVSEVAKLFAVLYLASYLQRFRQQVQSEWMGFIKPIALLFIIVALLLLEPDFGTAMVITITFLMLLFIAEVRLWPFLLFFCLIAAAMIVLAITSPYRLERLTTFLNPWKTAYGSGYQLIQSLIAFGRGGIWGVGLGNSVQKLFYLPEAHTDFIFAVVAEELGLVGELLLIASFVILIARIFVVGQRAQRHDDLFSAYVAFSVGIWFAVQAMINVGVSAGVLPTKGLTLPFISYGGSSLLINCLVIGIMLRLSYETQLLCGRLPKAKYKQAVVLRRVR